MISFDRDGFRKALEMGECNPPRLLTPMVCISRRAYRGLETMHKRKTLREQYTAAANRMTSEGFGQMRVGVERALRAAPEYFPAYEFHVGELINDEWLAAVDWHKEFHRDHLSHQLMCVYVGRALLNGGHGGEFLFSGRPLMEWCLDSILFAPECEYLREYLIGMGVPSVYGRRDAMGRKLWRQIFYESFFLSCMYHDIGYPWQYVHSIHDKLCPNSPDQCMLGAGVETIYSHYKNRLVMYPFNGYQPCLATQPSGWSKRAQTGVRDGFLLTHGVPGAFAFLHLNDLVREYPPRSNANAVSRFCIEWAAMAIAMHDLQKVYVGKGCEAQPHLRVSFKRDPLSFLVTLTDQLQDFGRPAAIFNRQSGKVGLTYDAACHKVEAALNPATGEVTATYFFNNLLDARNNKIKFKKNDERDYFDPASGYLDCRGGPITGVRLQVERDPTGKWWQA